MKSLFSRVWVNNSISFELNPLTALKKIERYHFTTDFKVLDFSAAIIAELASSKNPQDLLSKDIALMPGRIDCTVVQEAGGEQTRTL